MLFKSIMDVTFCAGFLFLLTISVSCQRRQAAVHVGSGKGGKGLTCPADTLGLTTCPTNAILCVVKSDCPVRQVCCTTGIQDGQCDQICTAGFRQAGKGLTKENGNKWKGGLKGIGAKGLKCPDTLGLTTCPQDALPCVEKIDCPARQVCCTTGIQDGKCDQICTATVKSKENVKTGKGAKKGKGVKGLTCPDTLGLTTCPQDAISCVIKSDCPARQLCCTTGIQDGQCDQICTAAVRSGSGKGGKGQGKENGNKWKGGQKGNGAKKGKGGKDGNRRKRSR